MVDDGAGISGRIFTIVVSIVAALMTTIGGLLALVWSNNNRRMDDICDEIDDIKEDYVSRDTIINIQRDWRDEMRELREERKAFQDESKGWMLRIEAKIDSFKDEHLPLHLSKILSDVYGTIANNKRDFERQLDRIEGNTQRDP